MCKISPKLERKYAKLLAAGFLLKLVMILSVVLANKGYKVYMRKKIFISSPDTVLFTNNSNRMTTYNYSTRAWALESFYCSIASIEIEISLIFLVHFFFFFFFVFSVISYIKPRRNRYRVLYSTILLYLYHRACSIVYYLKCSNDRDEFSISRPRASEMSRWCRTWWNRWTQCRSSRSLVSRPRPHLRAPSPNTAPNALSFYRGSTASISSPATLASTVLRVKVKNSFSSRRAIRSKMADLKYCWNFKISSTFTEWLPVFHSLYNSANHLRFLEFYFTL